MRFLSLACSYIRDVYFARNAVISLILVLSIGAPLSGQTSSVERENTVSCESCPEFLSVPKPPDGLREIRYVAKYELTWNDYIASVDDGACKIPNPNRPPYRRRSIDDINPNLEWFRIDWPITILGPSEVQCYLKWLGARIGLKAALPTAEEWRWFAASGHPDFLYPWGNDPDGGNGALKGKSRSGIELTPWKGRREARYPNKYLTAFKVGQFRPNAWGIHDLMGNAPELTADIESRYPESNGGDGRPRAVMVGASHADLNWIEEGLNMRRYSIILPDQYSARMAIRTVLISEAADY